MNRIKNADEVLREIDPDLDIITHKVSKLPNRYSDLLWRIKNTENIEKCKHLDDTHPDCVGFSFGSEPHLNQMIQHIRHIHWSDSMYECGICNSKFEVRNRCLIHIQNVHLCKYLDCII